MYARRPIRQLPFPLAEPECRIFAWARHGIWHGVAQLGLRAGDEVLAPAWHHGSEIEALRRAGLAVRFYDCDLDSLEPDAGELERLIGPRARALYLVHPLGFPVAADRWREWCDERDMLLIEDAAQAWLATHEGRPAGSWGDLAVFCLYKTFGLPEGAAAIQRSPARSVGLDRRPGLVELARRHGMWLAGRSALVYAASGPVRRPRPYDPALDFDLRDPASAPWGHTQFVLRRIADPDAARVRRENYDRLLAELADAAAPGFSRLPAGASPFVFPIEVADKRATLDRLREQGISGLDVWAVAHPSLPEESFPRAASRRRSTIGLPVHQELRGPDLARIAEAASAAL